MKKEIVVFDKNKESLAFLKKFFNANSDYDKVVIKDARSLLKKISKKPPAACVVGDFDIFGNIAPSQLGCPVIAMVSGDLAGGINRVIKHGIEYYLSSPFTEKDFEYKLGMAIKKKSWFENACAEKKDLETVIELTHLVSSSLDPKEVLFFVVRKIAEVIDVTRCSIISIPFGEKRHADVISTFENSRLTNIKLDLKKYPEIRKALNTKSNVIVEDALRDPLLKAVRHLIAPIRIRSIVVIPIIFRNEVIGTLFLRTSRKGHKFAEREIRLCSAIADASSNALYNSFLYEKLETEKTRLEKLAVTDYLTGIYNIRYFYHRLEDEFSRAQRYKFPFSCIMFDIDHFKKINDTNGHRTGDMVLREFAQCIKKHIRKTDVFARYGGEEFIMILPQTSGTGALIEAKRLREIIREHRYKSLKKKKGITASIGIASYPNKKINIQDDLITFADNALFAAKQSGRDQIRLWR